MFLKRRIPLAWFDLVHSPKRFGTAVLGVAFAVFLMFTQMGFLNGVYDSQTDILDLFDADLFIVNRYKEDLLPTTPFSRRRLLQASAVDSVEAVASLYMKEFGSEFKNFADGGRHSILSIGIDPDAGMVRNPGIRDRLEELRFPGVALIDSASRPFFGSLRSNELDELAGRRLRLIGTFEHGPSFRWDGVLVMSDHNFLRFFVDPQTGVPSPDHVELGLVKIAQGAEQSAVRDAIERALPDDVKVLTRDKLDAMIRTYWQTYQPIGMIFGLGMAVGFVIGVAICYQILFTDINDRLPQFATLKAIGYNNRYLRKVVLEKAVLLAVFGFIPGVLMSYFSYSLIGELAGIRLWLTPERVSMVFGLAVVMCILSGLLAVRRVMKQDPASLY